MFYRRHNRVSLDCGNTVVTKQSHKAECDIHTILRQYQRTGIITHVQRARPTYLDLPDFMDFQTSLEVLREAETAFAALPARVRDHFANDPANFLAAFHDPKQADQLREFGLLKPLAASGSGGEPPPSSKGDPTSTPPA